MVDRDWFEILVAFISIYIKKKYYRITLRPDGGLVLALIDNDCYHQRLRNNLMMLLVHCYDKG